MDTFVASGKAGRRILVHAGRNVPASRREFEQFPPARFPIRLHFLFSSKDARVLENLKAALSGMAKDRARYRKAQNRYTSGISFLCYFNNVASMQPVMRAIAGENLWKGILLEDVPVSPWELVEQARLSIPSSKPQRKAPALLC